MLDSIWVSQQQKEGKVVNTDGITRLQVKNLLENINLTFNTNFCVSLNNSLLITWKLSNWVISNESKQKNTTDIFQRRGDPIHFSDSFICVSQFVALFVIIDFHFVGVSYRRTSRAYVYKESSSYALVSFEDFLFFSVS